MRAPVAGVLVGAALVALSQPFSLLGAVRHLPGGACLDATVRTVEERVDHLSDVLRAVEQGVDARSLPAAPSAARMSACSSVTAAGDTAVATLNGGEVNRELLG